MYDVTIVFFLKCFKMLHCFSLVFVLYMFQRFQPKITNMWIQRKHQCVCVRKMGRCLYIFFHVLPTPQALNRELQQKELKTLRDDGLESPHSQIGWIVFWSDCWPFY